MKNIYKFLIVCSVFMISSCGLTELDLLDNPNEVTPDNAEISLFFNRIQVDFERFFEEVTDETDPLTRMTAMTAGNIYVNAVSANGQNGAWNRAYADLFPDIDQLIVNAESEGSKIPTYAGIGKFLKAYTLMTLVDMYGDVPLSEAGQGVSNPSPKADDQEGLYNTALALIDAAITDFNTEGPNIGSNDLFYGGDNAKWLAAANTLKIKWYLTTRLVSGNAASEISSIVDGGVIIDEAGEDLQYNYGTSRENPDARHWWFTNQYEAIDGAYLSNYYMWSLNSEKGIRDPRTSYYFYRQDLEPELADAFTLDCNSFPRPLHYSGDYPWCTETGGYWGRDHGNNDGIPPDGDRRTVFGLYPAGGKFDNGTGGSTKNGGTDGAGGQGIAPILLSSFTHFMLAESALVLGTTGSASEFLEKGIRQSMAKVMSFGSLDGGADGSLLATPEQVDEYVSFVMDAYSSAGDDGKLDIIMKEYHIALWGNGIEAYNNYRRTGYPSNMQPTREPNSGEFPRLLYYPADFINLNATIGNQRELTEQVFWDTNPAGFIQ